MNILELILKLHGGSTADAIEVLNQAQYVSTASPFSKEDVFVSLGFGFQTQTGKAFELFLAASSESLLYQRRLESARWPRLIGLAFSSSNSEYIDTFNSSLMHFQDNKLEFLFIEDLYAIADKEYIDEVSCLRMDGETMQKVVVKDFSFLAYNEDGEESIVRVPLYKKLGKQLFYDGSRFKVDNPNYRSDNYERHEYDYDYHEYRHDRQLAEQQDRDNFYALTDGMFGDYEDFDGDIDDVKTWLGRD